MLAVLVEGNGGALAAHHHEVSDIDVTIFAHAAIEARMHLIGALGLQAIDSALQPLAVDAKGSRLGCRSGADDLILAALLFFQRACVGLVL